MPEPSMLMKHLVIQDAKFDCFRTAAQYLGQASDEGRLADFLSAVLRVYLDRWPNDEEVNIEKVHLGLAMASLSCAQDPVLHWETVLSVDYDRLHRPTLRDVARLRGFEHYNWPMPTPQHSSTNSRKEADGDPNSDLDNLASVAVSSNKSPASASNSANGTAELDFLKPKFDIHDLLGEDAELLLSGIAPVTPAKRGRH
ncbi:hypothetical protein CVT26_000979 [Gymnopilus dilepis]|uniref:Uncharacterized protein n=1 Tax=Gymnopilus dilepis TaxID=231916 RepID=A0A409X7X6_9AGAR|nr:hypothetical protein CVT26_000979 [Gymnopilus dilepis]